MLGTFAKAAAVSALALVAFSSGAAAQQRNCADTLAGDPQLSRSTEALLRTGLLENLRLGGPYTVFAVTNQGIARHPEPLGSRFFPESGGGTRGGGPSIDPVGAPAVVNSHIVDGRVTSSELRPGQALRTRNGTTIEVASGQGGQVVLRPGPAPFSVGAAPEAAQIVQGDIQCSNGVIHKIDDVLVR